MNGSLEARRQKLLRKLAAVNRRIVKTQERLADLEAKLALAVKPQQKAA
jgi:hypothetical protein